MVDETEDDLLEKLLRLIHEGRQDEAVDLILAQTTLIEQLEIVERLADQLRRKTLRLRLHLALALGLRRALDAARAPDLALARALAQALAQALEIVHALDTDPALDAISVRQAIALALARDRDLTRKLALSLASHIALDVALELDRALDMSRGLDHGLALPRDQISYIARLIVLSVSGITNAQDISQLAERHRIQLANTLDESLFLQSAYAEPVLSTICAVLVRVAGHSLRHITLESARPITPDVLNREISAYLDALQGVQQVYDEIHGHSATLPRPCLIAVHDRSATIEIVNIADSICAINTVITRHKRRQDAAQRDLQRELVRLKHEAAHVENERTRMETGAFLQQQALENDQQLQQDERTARITQLRDETRVKSLEIAEAALAVQERRWQLEQAQLSTYVEIAKELLQALVPRDANIDDFVTHLPALVTAVRTLMESQLTPRIGHHDTPRPDTLPEFDNTH
ncbi:MAG: hypothetical protein KC547_03665 [Anaerolineae bacterium]|nr:hypothetical protein [Anaerolineae bacterium]